MHEINNPLGTLVNAAYALSADAAQDSNVRALAHTLRTEADRIHRLADTLAILCREQDCTRTRFNLTPVLEDLLLLASLEPGLRQRRKINATLPEHPLPVKGNPEQIRQVLWNLLLNASRHGVGNIELEVKTLRKGVTVTMRNRCAQESGSPTAQRHDGMGLGLCISSHILRRHRSALCLAQQDGVFESSFTLNRARSCPADALESPQTCVS
ncbi:HAMP domain-containing histidine kinase [Acidihalobacter ferrooxydans]|uniref:HAMP domain-containing histidine kinase n=1 Tax=Acidihalobacter ferrooxydans TaxID=1765967 RepID=UPI0018DD5F82|nr:HAMP domain-containing histidine kinase [Acidihalobacter ferrooxydans]